MEVKTGEIKVLIGGRDFSVSPYNRAVQAKRQPGSAFKPIIYLTALEQGYEEDMILRDAPVSFTNPYTGVVWSPKNYRNEYHGDVTMRKALELSLNTATVRLLEKVGVENVIDMAKQLHINSKFEPNLSLALGTTEVVPIELAAAYATFARSGNYMPPVAIKTIATIDGEEKYHEEALEEPIVVPEVAYALVDIMKGVIQRGTARAASKMPYYLAGKTGTTDDYRDAWFIGFSPNLLCAVWVGYDKKINLDREAGASVALPIWMDFMSKALQQYPNDDFVQPKDEYSP
jgi:penicillin-binding protein 1A